MAVFVITFVILVALIAVGWITLSAYIGYRLVNAGSSRHHIAITARTTSTLTLQKTHETVQPGTYGVWVAERRGHLLAGPVVGETANTVTREVIAEHGSTSELSGAEFTGHTHFSPSDLAYDYVDVELTSEAGVIPAWHITPPLSSDSDMWAIHVHGIGSTRTGALRTVVAAANCHEQSLVMAYRNSSEGPRLPRSASMLGQTEWKDLEAAVHYALSHGARSVTVYAWSMGAAILNCFLAQSELSPSVTKAVLIAPALDWNVILRDRVVRAHLPAIFARHALGVLASPLSRFLGLSQPYSPTLAATENIAWPPTLIIHSPDDPEVPVDVSRIFIRHHPDTHLVELPSQLHACEYNVDPERFETVITEWSTTP